MVYTRVCIKNKAFIYNLTYNYNYKGTNTLKLGRIKMNKKFKVVKEIVAYFEIEAKSMEEAIKEVKSLNTSCAYYEADVEVKAEEVQ